MELPSERSTSARIDSNEVVEVNEENNDGEGDDECAPAPLPVVLVLVGGGGHAIKGASCFVRLGVLIIMMLSGCSLEVCVGRIELLPGRLWMQMCSRRRFESVSASQMVCHCNPVTYPR